MDFQQLFDLAKSHKWLALAAIVIGLSVRLLKSDTKLPLDIPPRVRPWLALGLGVVAGVLDKASSGASWPESILGGLLAAATAMIGHDVLVESLSGGKEMPLPGLMKEPAPPAGPSGTGSPGDACVGGKLTPPSNPREGNQGLWAGTRIVLGVFTFIVLPVAILGCFSTQTASTDPASDETSSIAEAFVGPGVQLTGCTKQQGAILQKVFEITEPLACALATSETNQQIVMELCKVPPSDIEKVVKILVGKERAGFGKAKGPTGLAPAKAVCP